MRHTKQFLQIVNVECSLKLPSAPAFSRKAKNFYKVRLTSRTDVEIFIVMSRCQDDTVLFWTFLTWTWRDSAHDSAHFECSWRCNDYTSSRWLRFCRCRCWSVNVKMSGFVSGWLNTFHLSTFLLLWLNTFFEMTRWRWRSEYVGNWTCQIGNFLDIFWITTLPAWQCTIFRPDCSRGSTRRDL